MHIPNWLDESLGNAFGEITESVESDFEVEGNITEICHKSYDGFIPFTNGGVEFTAPIGLDYAAGTGNIPNNKEVADELERATTYGYTLARQQLIENNREALNQIFTKKELDENSDNVNYHSLYELDHGDLAEELSESESECNSETFFIQHRAMFFSADNSRNETGKDEIYFYSGVNTDYDYGRDKGLIDCFEVTIPVGDLTPNKVNEIVKKMLHSI